MRLRVLGVAALSAALAGATATTAPATAIASVPATSPTSASASATVSTIVRPVTSAGHPANGFRVTVRRHRRWAIDCSYAYPSPGAVDRNIEECSPSAADAVACWKVAKTHHALCLQDPSSHRLYRLPLMGSFAKTTAVKSRLRAPLRIVLANGNTCSIRDGGAWGTLKSHPKWIGRYSCTHGVVWAPPRADHYGINESSSAWTVKTGPSGGKGKVTVRRVTHAYFVGTASG